MKKEWVVLFTSVSFMFLIAFASAGNSSVTGAVITGDTINGKATSTVGVYVTVLGVPSISIQKPENKTYFASTNLKLIVTSNSNDIFYQLDSNSRNVSVIGGTAYFNASDGGHKIYVYSNSSAGLNGTNLNFSVNSGEITVDCSLYEGENKGSSVEVNQYTMDELQSMTGIVFEHTNWGKIDFGDDLINLTDDENPNDGIVNLSKNVNISFNRIELNSSALPNFNKKATLEFYNLSFSNPRILKDGSVCSSECARNYYSNGELSFNVTEFSVYSAEETPSTGGESPGAVGEQRGGGGGGSTGVAIVGASFKLSSDLLKVSLLQGETERVQFTIENTGRTTISLNIGSELRPALDGMLFIHDKEVDLNPGEKKTIDLDVVAGDKALPDFYLGKIIVSSGRITHELPVLIQVNQPKSLLDVKASIPGKYVSVSSGDELLSEIKLYNFGETGRVDVLVKYSIEDISGKVFANESETVAVETQTSYVKWIKLPDYMPRGQYVLLVRTEYSGEIALASANFQVSGAFITTIMNHISEIVMFILTVVVFLIIRRMDKPFAGKGQVTDKMIKRYSR